MSRTRVGWMFGAVAPWCMGLGLAVSVPADAGIDSSIGASLSPAMREPVREVPGDLVPAARAGLHLDYAGGALPLIQARLSIGERDALQDRGPVEQEPRRDLKPSASTFPEANRSSKGDPFVGLRPTFDARLRANGVAGYRQSTLVSGRRYLAFEALKETADPQAQVDAARRLTQEKMPDGGTGRSARPGRAGVSPRVSVAGLLAGGARRNLDGSTPQVARAMAMSSVTPAPFDEQLQVVYAPVVLVGPDKAQGSEARAAQAPGERPDYASLVDQSNAAREERCLAEAIYFEARSEPEAGQAAVAQVVLNRVKSGLYPSSICGVVYQNRHRHLRCQFTFACEGKSLRITEPEPWRTAVRIASEVLEGRTFLADVGGSTHYHATYVRPRWAKRLKKMDKIGTHIFYKLRPGQT